MPVGVSSLALIVYTWWKVWILKDRWEKTKETFIVDQRPAFVFEALYTILMIYLLLVASTSFLVIAIIGIMFNLFLGLYVVIFKPEIDISEDGDLIGNYWQYVALDSIITIMSFAIVAGGN